MSNLKFKDELIPVYETDTVGKAVCVSELYMKLGMNCDFNVWSANMLINCNAVEREDYITNDKKLGKSRILEDYIIRLDLAIKIIEKSDLKKKGIVKRLIKYFTKLNKVGNSNYKLNKKRQGVKNSNKDKFDYIPLNIDSNIGALLNNMNYLPSEYKGKVQTNSEHIWALDTYNSPKRFVWVKNTTYVKND